jgi:hypothetical protein
LVAACSVLRLAATIRRWRHLSPSAFRTSSVALKPDAASRPAFHALPGGVGGIVNKRWDGDRLIFSVSAITQTVAGVVTVLESAVTMEIELPGVLGLLAGGLRGRLQKVGQLLLSKK